MMCSVSPVHGWWDIVGVRNSGALASMSESIQPPESTWHLLVAFVLSGLNITQDVSCCQVQGGCWELGEPPFTSQLSKSRWQRFAAWPQLPLQTPLMLSRSDLHRLGDEGPARGRWCRSGIVIAGVSVFHSMSQPPVILE